MYLYIYIQINMCTVATYSDSSSVHAYNTLDPCDSLPLSLFFPPTYLSLSLSISVNKYIAHLYIHIYIYKYIYVQ